MRLLKDRLLVQRAPVETQTEGGILLPEASQGKPNQGTVMAVGPGKIYPGSTVVTPISVEVGETVVFNKYLGFELDNDQIVIRESDILMVL